jgi:hypothetical protein
MRKLSLSKETLAELTAAELVEVAAGATTNCPANTALTCAGPCHSDFAECITGFRCLSVAVC